MTVIPDIQLQFNLDSDVYTDLSADVLTEPQFTSRSGIFGQKPTNRVASPGTLKFTLDNSSNNSGGVLGYYTPTSSNCLAGFAEGVGVRLAITYDSDVYYKWVGRVTKITPDAGRYGKQETVCEAKDWIGDSTKIKPEGLAIQTSKRGDELLVLALAAITNQPTGTSLSEGKSTFAYAFDEIRDGGTTMHQIMKSIAMSELGYIGMVGDTDTGGVLTFWNRHDRVTTTDILITMDDDGDDDDFDFISLEDNEQNILNIIQATAYPRTVDSDATAVLWELTGDDITIASGETVSLVGKYTDCDSPGTRIGGTEMVTPTTDDYAFSTGDTNISVVATLGGNAVEWEITNNSAASGDITKLQVRGKRVLIYRPVRVEASDSDSVAAYQDRKIPLNLSYQNKMVEAQDFVDVILTWYKDEVLQVKSVTFSANRNDTIMKAALKGEMGCKITLSETVAGISAGSYFINGTQLAITQGDLIKVTWSLTPADGTVYWILGTSKLDTETLLGF